MNLAIRDTLARRSPSTGRLEQFVVISTVMRDRRYPDRKLPIPPSWPRAVTKANNGRILARMEDLRSCLKISFWRLAQSASERKKSAREDGLPHIGFAALALKP